MTRKPWTPEEDRLLCEQYSSIEASAIADRLGRSTRSVYCRAQLLGLRKPLSFFSAAGKKGTTHPDAIAHRFRKGCVPANKGRKVSPELYAKMAPTMFRKGQIPANHRPVGSERVNVDGYIEIKVAEPNKWKQKHRVVWEAANGPVPKGYNIQFRNGVRTDCDIDNLYIISRSEQLQTQNSIYCKYPEELRNAIRVKATLKRQITIYNKKHHE